MNKAEKLLLIREQELHDSMELREKCFGKDSYLYSVSLLKWAEFYRILKKLNLTPIRYKRCHHDR